MKACLVLAAVLMLSPALAAEPPAAAPQCAPWATVKQDLIVKFHEVQIGGGLLNEHTLLAVFASAGGATWTTIALGSNGTACVLSTGTDWFFNAPPAPVPGGRQS